MWPSGGGAEVAPVGGRRDAQLRAEVPAEAGGRETHARRDVLDRAARALEQRAAGVDPLAGEPAPGAAAVGGDEAPLELPGGQVGQLRQLRDAQAPVEVL